MNFICANFKNIFSTALIGTSLLFPFAGFAETIRIPVRWCVLADMDTPFTEADPGGGPSFEDPSIIANTAGDPTETLKQLLWNQHERVTDNVFLPQADITFRSGAVFAVPEFPVIDDITRLPGDKPGDVLNLCAADGSGGGLCSGQSGDGGAEIEDALMRCKEAWEPLDDEGNPEATDGIIALQINQFTNLDGTPFINIAGIGRSGGPTGPRLAVVDLAYLFPGSGETYEEIEETFGVPGDWQQKTLAHEFGHALGEPHIQPLMCDTCDNLMQYQFPLDPDPSVSMFGTLLESTQIENMRDFACGNIGGVENCPPSMAIAGIGSLRDPIDSAAVGFGDIVGMGLSQREGQDLIRVSVEFREGLPEIAFFQVFIFLNLDGDPSTGGDGSGLLPNGFVAPLGSEAVIIAQPAAQVATLFRLNGDVFEIVASDLDVATRPTISFADPIGNGAPDEAQNGFVADIDVNLGALGVLTSTPGVFVQSLAPLPDGGAIAIDALRGRLNLDTPVFPQCTVDPDIVLAGETFQMSATGLPREKPVVVLLGETHVGSGQTDEQGVAIIDVDVPGDARAGRRLITVGIDDDRTAITADCEITVRGDGKDKPKTPKYEYQYRK